MEEDIDLIRARFRALMNTLGVDADQILMDNQPEKNIDEKRAWARFQINPGDGEQRGLSSGIRVFRVGMIILQIFVPKGTGSRNAYTIAQNFMAIFWRWRVGSPSGKIQAEVGFTRPGGDDSFFQVNATIPYESYRTFPTP